MPSSVVNEVQLLTTPFDTKRLILVNKQAGVSDQLEMKNHRR